MIKQNKSLSICYGIFFILFTVKHPNHTIFGRHVLSCPGSSCRGRCDQPIDNSTHCSCDERCRILGDCCVDAHVLCFGANQADTHMLKPTAEQQGEASILRESMEELVLRVLGVKYGTNLFVLNNRRMRVVSSCPVETGITETCDKLEEGAGKLVLMCHLGAQLIFINPSCAACHGYPLEELIPFGVHFSTDCLTSEDLKSATIPTWCYPYAVFEQPPGCEHVVERMTCYGKGDIPGPNKIPCRTYSNPVANPKGRHSDVYKNQFCIPRDRMDYVYGCPVKRVKQQSGFQSFVPIFSVVLDFKGKSHVVELPWRTSMFGIDSRSDGEKVISRADFTDLIAYSRAMRTSSNLTLVLMKLMILILIKLAKFIVQQWKI